MTMAVVVRTMALVLRITALVLKTTALVLRTTALVLRRTALVLQGCGYLNERYSRGFWGYRLFLFMHFLVMSSC